MREKSESSSIGPFDRISAYSCGEPTADIVLSFDVEEHFRIEAAAGLTLDPALKAHYSGRVAPSTYWLLDQLDRQEIKATFFVVGCIARSDPALIRSIYRAGHEVASHSWDHRRVHSLNPASFREDVRRSMDAIEQVTGAAVVGYRAPTFSIVRQTAWALDILAELDLLYDSSIYPVRHDRYGMRRAPRAPFLAEGTGGTILELPPATLRLLGINVPMGGWGLFPATTVAPDGAGHPADPARLPTVGGDALLPPLGIRPAPAAAPAAGSEPIPYLRRDQS
jgi:polysaccharide deacetylase family protein (PEP-CTERM system associated)